MQQLICAIDMSGDSDNDTVIGGIYAAPDPAGMSTATQLELTVPVRYSVNYNTVRRDAGQRLHSLGLRRVGPWQEQGGIIWCPVAAT